MKLTITSLASILLSVSAHASSNFKCSVLDAFILGEDGKIDQSSATNQLGKEFVVNRQTGQIIGGYFNNTMGGQMPKVFDCLPSKNGYKSITIYKPNFTIDYLHIREYAEGPNKPFMYKGAFSTTVTGLCTYYR